jgi:hypothetical protein
LHCNGRKSAFFILETQYDGLPHPKSPARFDTAATLRHSARPSNKTLFANPPVNLCGLILSGGVFSTAVFFEVVK